jgi:hypothetical protein
LNVACSGSEDPIGFPDAGNLCSAKRTDLSRIRKPNGATFVATSPVQSYKIPVLRKGALRLDLPEFLACPRGMRLLEAFA